VNWLLTAFLCAVLVEVALRLPFARAVAGVVRSGRRAVWVLRAKASDHWKEKAMGAYAKSTFLGSMTLAVLIAALLAVAVVLALVFDLVAPGYMAFLVGWQGILASVVLAFAYYYARKAVLGGRV